MVGDSAKEVILPLKDEQEGSEQVVLEGRRPAWKRESRAAWEDGEKSADFSGRKGARRNNKNGRF